MLLCSCTDTVPSESIETTFVPELTSEPTTNISIKMDMPVTTNPEEIAHNGFEDMMQAWIDKDEEKWKNHIISYPEGKEGYFYQVDLEEFRIINESYEYDDNFCNYYYNCDVEITVSSSNDSRFPEGKSVWKVLMNSGVLGYFLPENIDTDNLYYGDGQNEYALLGYQFSYSFQCFHSVDDMTGLPDDIGRDRFIDGMRAFSNCFHADGKTENDENSYSQFRVNEIMGDYLGIQNFQWNNDFNQAYFEGQLWKLWDMKEPHIIINEQTEDYIDMTYYADFVYLTPAKRMRYYFVQDKVHLRLIAVELIKDYGYEPNWEMA